MKPATRRPPSVKNSKANPTSCSMVISYLSGRRHPSPSIATFWPPWGGAAGHPREVAHVPAAPDASQRTPVTRRQQVQSLFDGWNLRGVLEDETMRPGQRGTYGWCQPASSLTAEPRATLAEECVSLVSALETARPQDALFLMPAICNRTGNSF